MKGLDGISSEPGTASTVNRLIRQAIVLGSEGASKCSRAAPRHRQRSSQRGQFLLTDARRAAHRPKVRLVSLVRGRGLCGVTMTRPHGAADPNGPSEGHSQQRQDRCLTTARCIDGMPTTCINEAPDHGRFHGFGISTVRVL